MGGRFAHHRIFCDENTIEFFMMGAEAHLLDVLDDIHTWNTYVYMYGWLAAD